jgi:hypothetical protein
MPGTRRVTMYKLIRAVALVLKFAACRKGGEQSGEYGRCG